MSNRDVNINKILLLRFSSLGDIVMTTAMIRCLRTRFPNAQIDMVVRRDFFDLIEYSPHLTNKLSIDRKEGWRALWALGKQINQTQYDLIYDAHRSLRTLLLMPFLKARYKVYFQKHYVRRNLSLLFKLPLIRGMPRFLERFIEPLKRFGVEYDHFGPELFLSPTAQSTARAKLPLCEKKNSLRVGLVPSAQWPGKRWPIENFKLLIESLVTKTDYELILFGGKEDTFCSDLALGFANDRVRNAQGKLTIAESTSLLSECDFVIANDTGLMHIADALKIPCVLFLGPTSGDLGCLPFHADTIVLEHTLWCRPCSKNGQAPCIRLSRKCLTQTTPQMAFDAALALSKKLRRKQA